LILISVANSSRSMKGPNRSSSNFSNNIRHFSAKSNTIEDITYTNIRRQFFRLAKSVETRIDGEYWVLFLDSCFSRKLVVREYAAFFVSL